MHTALFKRINALLSQFIGIDLTVLHTQSLYIKIYEHRQVYTTYDIVMKQLLG